MNVQQAGMRANDVQAPVTIAAVQISPPHFTLSEIGSPLKLRRAKHYISLAANGL